MQYRTPPKSIYNRTCFHFSLTLSLVFSSFSPSPWSSLLTFFSIQYSSLRQHRSSSFETFNWWCGRVIKISNRATAIKAGCALGKWRIETLSNKTRYVSGPGEWMDDGGVRSTRTEKRPCTVFSSGNFAGALCVRRPYSTVCALLPFYLYIILS